MNRILFAVSFPFIAGILLWGIFRKRTSDKVLKLLSVSMILVSAVEFAVVAQMLICDVSSILQQGNLWDANQIGGHIFPEVQTALERTSIAGVGALGLHFQYTGFRGIFGVLAAFAWFVTFLYAKEYMKNDTNVIRYDFFNLFTLGATMGIFYAADLFTLFFFFEIMSFTSFMWVVHRQTKEAFYAAGTYLGIAIAGGMAILMGLFLVYNKLGTLYFGEMYDKAVNCIAEGGAAWLYVAAGCMFVGFGAKAGAFPVHVWLPQSYTEAPAPATALLSAILSKTGVFGLLMVTLEVLPEQGNWGLFLLIIGVITMVLGGIKGVMSDNFKTTLAYSSMSQIGFILVGVGMQGLLSEMMVSALSMGLNGYEGTEKVWEAYCAAINGTLLHMLNHSLVKLVLFLIAGIVFVQVGSYELNKVRGFGRKKPFLLVTFLLAAAGVGGIPLVNGYISKTLLHESITAYTELLEGDMIDMASAALQNYAYMTYSPMLFKAVEYLFLFSGGLTIAYMTKLFVVLFVEKNQDQELQKAYELKKDYASVWSKLAVGLCVLPIPLIGLLPHAVADSVAAYGFVWSSIRDIWEMRHETVHYFIMKNLSGALISVLVGIVVYFLIVRLLMLRKKEEGYRGIYPAWLDMEKYVYRAVFYTAVPFVLGIISRILDSIVDTIVVILRKTVYRDRELPHELPEGNRFTHRIGCSIEQIRKLYCIIMKKDYKPKNYEHKLAIKSTDLFENFCIIERSLSFGLFMFCVGLGLTMIYLLMVN